MLYMEVVCLRYRDLTCDICGFQTVYSIDNTWYLECVKCGNVLVDIILDESILEELDVVCYDGDCYDGDIKNFEKF